MKIDYLIIGAGLTGAAIARTLVDAGREVLILERRPFIGGNCRDDVHLGSGLRFHCHGPHYFRTNSERIWEWVQRFGKWYSFAAEVRVQLESGSRELINWPLRVGQEHLFEPVIHAYNRKMWGEVEVPAEISTRVELRTDPPDFRLKTSRFQGLPRAGYSQWFAELLRDITVVTRVKDFRDWNIQTRIKTIHTGPIDEYFGYDLGKLHYRGQQRKVIHFQQYTPMQPVVQINRPGTDWNCLRTIEWNHLQESPSWDKGVLVTYETPFTPTDPDQYEYPYNDDRNRALYHAYQKRAVEQGILFAGRLGLYRYLDMDQALASALQVAERLLEERP